MLAIITRQKLSKRSSKFQWKWCYGVALDGGKPTTIGESLLEAESWAKRHGATQIVRNWMPNSQTPPQSRPSTNFKRRGRMPAGATTTPQPKPTNAKKSVGAVSVNGSRVEFEQNGVTAMLDCDGELHARLIAQALSDGLVHFDTRCE